jgi:hypothetical protein
VTRAAAAGLLAALGLAGCFAGNSTTKKGMAGDTLSAGGLKVSLIRFDTRVPPKRGIDVTGLGTPGPGERFFGADVKVCNDRGQAIGTYNFGLQVDGGKASVRFPQSVYSNGFDSVRATCGRGWIVFEAPSDSRAKTVTFRYDDTGSNQPSGNREKHAHFSWDVG